MNKPNDIVVYHHMALTEEDMEFVQRRRLLLAGIRGAVIALSLLTCAFIIQELYGFAQLTACLAAAATFFTPWIENDFVLGWVLGEARQEMDDELLASKARQLQREKAYKALARDLAKSK